MRENKANNMESIVTVKKNAKNNLKNFNFSVWMHNHLLAYKESIRSLYSAPIANLFTMSILGIALALPFLLYLIILNASIVLNTWQQDFYQYSLYLDSNLSMAQANVIKNNLSTWPEIAKIDVVPKEQGIEELKTVLGIEEILKNIDYNPLPIVLVVNLKPEYRNIDSMKKIISKSNTVMGVTKADADIMLLERLTNILKVFTYVVYIFSFVLGVAILLVISNTIRLMLENKQQEMVLLSMLGATMSYIRRPYLYGGIIYGLFAGVTACIVASCLFAKLYNTIDSLGYLRVINAELMGFSFSEILFLLSISSLLGWAAARMTMTFQTTRLQEKLAEL